MNLEVFLMMYDCETVNGVKVNKNFGTLQCWTGTHILHSAFAFFGFEIVLGIVFITTLFYFKT